MTQNKIVDELRAFRGHLYSAWASQAQDVRVNGATHPGLLEPMEGILKSRLEEFDGILSALLDELERKDAALRVAEQLVATANIYGNTRPHSAVWGKLVLQARAALTSKDQTP